MTKQKNASVTRRSSIAATALSAVALAGLTRRASAEEHKMSATEKTNAKIVGDFMKMWSAPDCTGEKLAAFVSNNCVLRMEENKPAVEGRANAVAAFDAFFKNGQRFGIDILNTFVIGPIVANSRSDYVIVPGKEPTGRFAVAGVFVLRDGKIQEWADYIVPKS
jgi:limonene-1,2-epoxide hydrolase